MKKFFAILAIAGALVACNDNSSTTNSTDTPTVVTPDSNTINNNVNVTVQDSNTIVVDSLKVVDSTKK